MAYTNNGMFQNNANILLAPSVDFVNNYQMMPNTSVTFMDMNSPVLYRKVSDMYGRILPLEIYDIVKRPDPTPVMPQQISDNYVTKDEIASIVSSAIAAEFDKRRNYHQKNQKGGTNE